MREPLKCPFPYFGGKRPVAAQVWRRLGGVDNYVEPFAGSLAVLLLRPRPRGVETVNDLDCVSPGTRILRDDLTWGLAGDVSVGDRLVGFDEQNGPARAGLRAPTRYRRLARATVTGVRRLVKPCYRLTFDDGTVVVASADHLWLGGSHKSGGRGWRWVKTANMVCNRRTQKTWVLKVADVRHREESWEAGWLGGLLDGEASLKAGPGLRVDLAQNGGPVLDQAERLLAARGFPGTRTGRSRCRHLQIGGGIASTLSLLMRLRPARLIAKLQSRLGEISLYGRQHRAVGLVSKEFLGEQEVVAIETDCHTFIAEGLASHNCYVANFWRATQRDPESVVDHADGPVNEADLHSRHRWLVLSDDAAAFRARMRTDPEYYDARVAGWWVWGLCCWIGSGWCDASQLERHQNQRPATNAAHGLGVDATPVGSKKKPRHEAGHSAHGNGVHAKGGALKRPAGERTLTGVHNDPPLKVGRPQLADAYDVGRGVHASPPGASGLSQQVPKPLGDCGPRAGRSDIGTCAERREWLLDWFSRLRDRLRNLRVCCGDWSRVCSSESVTTRLGVTGVFLDPPYSAEAGRAKKIYSAESLTVAHDVRRWCLERGGESGMRICLAGYAGEGHEELVAAGWREVAWRAAGGYSNMSKNNKNREKERLWFSPHCQHQKGLFDSLGESAGIDVIEVPNGD